MRFDCGLARLPAHSRAAPTYRPSPGPIGLGSTAPPPPPACLKQVSQQVGVLLQVEGQPTVEHVRGLDLRQRRQQR